MTNREVMQMALEALETYQSQMSVQKFDDAVAALRAALAEPEQKPQHDYLTRYDRTCYKCSSLYCPGNCADPYTAPPQSATLAEPTCQESLQVEPMHPEIRKVLEDYFDKCFAVTRKPLDDLAIADIYIKWDATPGASMADYARAIERAHGIRG